MAEDRIFITEEPKGSTQWFAGLLRNFEESAVQEVATTFITAVGKHVQDRARLNAPILENRLRPSIQFTGIKKTGTYTWVGQVVAGGDGIYWAGLQHAYLSPFETGPHPLLGRPYNQGPISRVQPTTEEGGVGGQFLSRVGEFHFAKYEKALQESFAKLAHSGTKPSFKF